MKIPARPDLRTTPANDAPDDEFHLSVVATSRNDDHGGSLTRRMQHFIDGFVAQCKRHRLRAELILVEWNPPADRAPLVRELRWPVDPEPCEIRIITVPPEVHRMFQHSDKIRLFQMIAKNVGIRRARGKFVLATNIDVLFSDGAVCFLRDRLEPGRLYLADRLDVPAEVPASNDFGGVLRFCRDRSFRIHAGGFTAVRSGGRWRYFDLVRAAMNPLLHYVLGVLAMPFAIAVGPVTHVRRASEYLSRHLPTGAETGRRHAPARRRWSPLSVAKAPLLLVMAILRMGAQKASRAFKVVTGELMPFTNACGDFTVMSRQDWIRLRGYAEWRIFSLHLDSLLVFQAHSSGIKAQRLGHAAHVFHIEHEGGYDPAAAGALFRRLEDQGIPFLSDADLMRLHSDIVASRRSRHDIHFNQSDWGLEGHALPEASPGKASREPPATAAAACPATR